MPTIQIKCPKCENNLAFWWLRQLRAADESEGAVLPLHGMQPHLAPIRLIFFIMSLPSTFSLVRESFT